VTAEFMERLFVFIILLGWGKSVSLQIRPLMGPLPPRQNGSKNDMQCWWKDLRKWQNC